MEDYGYSITSRIGDPSKDCMDEVTKEAVKAGGWYEDTPSNYTGRGPSQPIAQIEGSAYYVRNYKI